ncbi:MAG: DUF4258 domain-containing protein [Halothece sp.]
MKSYRWNSEKNIQLQEERDISFEDILAAIQQGSLLDVIEHPNQEKYSHQKVFIIKVKDYVYLVPFVENSEEIFLKTIIPSRKMKRKYLGG